MPYTFGLSSKALTYDTVIINCLKTTWLVFELCNLFIPNDLTYVKTQICHFDWGHCAFHLVCISHDPTLLHSAIILRLLFTKDSQWQKLRTVCLNTPIIHKKINLLVIIKMVVIKVISACDLETQLSNRYCYKMETCSFKDMGIYQTRRL